VPSTNVAPCGSWKSPITADLIASSNIGLGQVTLDGNETYWVEQRPSEGGRSVIVRRGPDGRLTDMTSAPFNARNRVHEYGGGAFAVAAGVVYFCHFADQRLYRVAQDGQARPLTPEGACRYADGVVDRQRGRMVWVCEDHGAGKQEPVNTLVAIDVEGRSTSQILVGGSDFYSSPRLSPDGSRLAWLSWNHPNMPWDGTALWVGEITPDGSVRDQQLVAGGAEEAVFQPEWSPDGVLHFVSDRTGWWNLYRWQADQVDPLCPMAAEFGLPQWIFGMSTYGFDSAARLVCTYAERGVWRLATLDCGTLRLTPLDLPYSDIGGVTAGDGRVVFMAASPAEALAIVEIDLATGRRNVLRRSTQSTIEAGYLSQAEAIEFPTAHGRTAFAFFYRPVNRDYQVPAGERPPLLVLSHGGPTAAASSALKPAIQYWTSRGIAVVDVNYGGSTGYGRAYRGRLDGQWGIVDVDDCVNAARYLVERGDVDGDRLIIRGGSAGGYTTLCALTFRDVFKAGASYYGIGDLEALARDTHKFEARYEDRLVGPYPQRRDLYRQRSPIHFTDRLSCPVIFFQGLDDKVVPPNQAEAMVAALRAKNLSVAYVPFEGEQHGFRRAETIKRALEAELYFYSRVFGFEAADPIEPVPIDNM